MDFITVFSTILKYGTWASLAALVLAAVYITAHMIYKRVFHGTASLALKQWIVLILLSAWFVLVLGLTTFNRGANYAGEINLSLFSGYITAWNQWSYTELQLIIFNMLMFAPLGFLLPLLLERGKKFPFACAVSFCVTLSIEVLQLITGRGIFELDDLLHNFVGSLFGYFVSTFILDCVSSKKIRLQLLLCMLSIPMIFAIGISAAVILYQQQSYGNWAFVPAERQDMSIVHCESSADLSDEAEATPVYQNTFANDIDSAKHLGEALSDFCGIKLQGHVRAEGNNRIFETDNGGQITYFTRDGFLSYISWKTPATISETACENNRQEIEAWLLERDLLPENAQFSFQDNVILRWDIDATGATSKANDYRSGLIMVQFDEANEIASFDYQISHNVFVGTEDMISPQEAYLQVLAGNFEQYAPFNAGDNLHITDCRLEYAYDTKGYYRPVYRFSGFVNDADSIWECLIPAMD